MCVPGCSGILFEPTSSSRVLRLKATKTWVNTNSYSQLLELYRGRQTSRRGPASLILTILALTHTACASQFTLTHMIHTWSAHSYTIHALSVHSYTTRSLSAQSYMVHALSVHSYMIYAWSAHSYTTRSLSAHSETICTLSAHSYMIHGWSTHSYMTRGQLTLT